MSVGTKIRRLRLQNKWSQEELAHKLNVAQTSVSNFESNKTIPDFLVMQKYIFSLFSDVRISLVPPVVDLYINFLVPSV